MARGRMFEENDFNSLPAESDYMSPFAVQPSYVPAPVASPLAVQPSYAPMGGDYDLSPEVLAQLAALGFDPYGGGQTPMANPVSSPLTVRGMPEMDPNEVSPLAVQGPVAASSLADTPGVTVIPTSGDDLSQFGGLGPIDGYEANFNGVSQAAQTSYAFPENYGNPKNKIYNLTVNNDDKIRLKLVDGTTVFEGQGPEAAAKAAAMVQEFGKQFGTQSTWLLDKQTAGGDWKQVSQDTVGDKKKTALNSFLDVAAPIAGALLAVIPGGALVTALGNAAAGAVGAAGGSLLNSGLQNQNSAEAFKKAAIAAAGSYIGSSIAPNVTSALKGLGPATPVGTLAGNAVEKSLAAAAEQAAAQGALSQGIATTVIPMAAKLGLTSAVAPSIGAGLSGLVQPNFNPTLNTTVPKQDLAPKTEAPPAEALPADTTQPIQDFEVMGSRPIPASPLNVIGAGLPTPNLDTSQFAVKPFDVTPEPAPTDGIEEIVVTAPKPVPTPPVDPLAVIGAGTTSAFPKLDTSQFEVKPFEPTPEPAPTDGIEEIVVTAKPKIDPLTVAGAGVPTPTFDTSPFEVKPFDTTPKPPAPTDNIEEIVVTAPEKITPIGALGAGVTLTGPTTPPIEEIVVPGTRAVKTDQVVPAAAGAGVGALVNTTPTPPTPPIEEIVIQAEKLPEKVQYQPAAEAAAGIVAANTLANTLDTTPKTPMEKTQDWIKKHPLEAASLGLTLIGGLGGAGSGGGSGGSGINTLGYPGGNQPGTMGSLNNIFTSKLPTGTGSGLAVTPRDMGQRDWLRYGFGPEASFFSNVPDRQALAVQKPTIAAMPALSEKLNEPAPDLMVKPDTQTASVPADGTMLNGNPSIVWNGGVNGGWMQTERGMPPPEEIATQAPFARGGRTGGTSRKPRTEFAVHGAGTGRSDDIPAVLSDGEYVMDAETVALLGDGSSKAGAKKLDELRVNLRRHKGANLAKGRFSVNAKSPEKYLTGGRV